MTTTIQPLGKIRLNNVRCAFAHGLFEATVVGTDATAKPRFGASFLLGPDHPQLAELNALIEKVAADKWKDKAPAILNGLRKTDKVCLHDGDTKALYDGYAGNYFITAAAQEGTPPTIYNADKTPFDAKKGHQRIYSGCYVNAIITVWAMDNNFGKRINASLGGVQFFKNGDSFSAASAASSDDFEEVTEGADADDFT
jgi:hypothetical protein